MDITKSGKLIFILLLFSFFAKAQDTLKLSLSQCESLFLQQNLLLMAEQLNIDAAEAQIRQARLWDNPEFTVEHQIINRHADGPVGFTETDNTVFEIEQLIRTGGKRGHLVRLLELEKVQAEFRFDLLLREFKRSLRESFFSLAFLNRVAGLYQEQIDALENILLSFEEQHERGNVSRIEVMRMRNLLLELEQEYSEVLYERQSAQNTLQILLQTEDMIPLPVLPENVGSATMTAEGLDLNNLYAFALTSRSDLMAMQASQDAAQQLLRLERSNALPDVEVGLVYDRLDGPVDNYFGLSLNLPLPLWNRNQGNIQMARHQIRQSEIIVSEKQQRIRHEIAESLQRYQRASHLLGRLDDTFEDDFSAIMEVLLRQYQQGDIRLIEFIDFYASFREGVKRNFSIQEEFLKAAEDLNFTMGQDIFQFNF